MDNTKIKNEIEKTLNSVNDFEKYEGNPFLFTRVEAEIEALENRSFISIFSTRYAFQLQAAVLVIVLFLNIYTGIAFYTSQPNLTSQADTEIDSFIEEYALVANTYDLSSLNE